MRSTPPLFAAAVLALAGCASVAPPAGPAVSVINSLSFDNAITGKRDGLRSAWPAAALSGTTEQFPLAQIKQCDSHGGACSWGVLKARRSFGKVGVVPAGVALDVEVSVELERSAHASSADQDATLTIPADVAALHARRVEKRTLVLAYGAVTRIDLGYGIGYELCALRLDAARQALDKCAVAYY